MSNQAMTNDKQVEAWRKEFLSLDLQHGDEIIDGYLWDGFVAAKRSMPPIELPYPEPSSQRFCYPDSWVHTAITAAGYSYRLKE